MADSGRSLTTWSDLRPLHVLGVQRRACRRVRHVVVAPMVHPAHDRRIIVPEDGLHGLFAPVARSSFGSARTSISARATIRRTAPVRRAPRAPSRLQCSHRIRRCCPHPDPNTCLSASGRAAPASSWGGLRPRRRSPTPATSRLDSAAGSSSATGRVLGRRRIASRRNHEQDRVASSMADARAAGRGRLAGRRSARRPRSCAGRMRRRRIIPMRTTWPVVVTRRTKSSRMSSAWMLPSTRRASTRPPPRSLRSMSPSTPSRSTSPSTAATFWPPRSWRVTTPPRTSGDADAPAGRLQLGAGAQPRRRDVAAEGLGLDRHVGRHLQPEIDAAAGERQRALAPAQLDARVDLRSRRSRTPCSGRAAGRAPRRWRALLSDDVDLARARGPPDADPPEQVVDPHQLGAARAGRRSRGDRRTAPPVGPPCAARPRAGQRPRAAPAPASMPARPAPTAPARFIGAARLRGRSRRDGPPPPGRRSSAGRRRTAARSRRCRPGCGARSSREVAIASSSWASRSAQRARSAGLQRGSSRSSRPRSFSIDFS